MKLSSPAFAEGELIPSKYTCDGENVSPPLEWEGVPEQAKSLALITDTLMRLRVSSVIGCCFRFLCREKDSRKARGQEFRRRHPWQERVREGCLRRSVSTKRHASLLLPSVCARCTANLAIRGKSGQRTGFCDAPAHSHRGGVIGPVRSGIGAGIARRAFPRHIQ